MRHSGSVWLTDYDLSNENVYRESCASAAMVLWNHQLFNASGDARYTDVKERSLSNHGFLPSLGQCIDSRSSY
jgi:DUF1680 family protein